MTRSAPATSLPDRHSGRDSRRPFPRYRHRPGSTPHPVRHPEGHLYGMPEAVPEPFDPAGWSDCREYLYGADLYNHGYYWEAHEAWEGLWKTTGRTDEPGRFLQGLIQVAAAVLKRRVGCPAGMVKLARKGMRKLRWVAATRPEYAGLALEEFLDELDVFWEAAVEQESLEPPLIVLKERTER